jgi:hypothetical protein
VLQAGPGGFDARDLFGDAGLVAGEAFGQHHVVGPGVMRLCRILVGRRDDEGAGVGLGVPAFARAEDHRPAGHVAAARRGEFAPSSGGAA